MTGAPPIRRPYLPSLAAELPEGWSVSEGATFSSPSGIDIHLRLNRAPDDLDAAGLAAQMEVAARSEIDSIDNVSASTVALDGGRVAHERSFSCVRDGVPSVGRILCVVEGGLALTAAASWPVQNDGAEAEMNDALARVRLLSRPLADVRMTPDGLATRTPVKRSPVDAAAWTDLRSQWSSSQPVGADLQSRSRWSPAELAVCATILGASSFPTVGAELLGSMPEIGLNATLDTVTRSFLARGLVRAGDDGFAALAEQVEPVMEVAAFPDLTILVERLGPDGNGRCWFGLRTDSAVQVSVLPDGSRECGLIEPAQVIAQLFAVTGTGSATPGAASAGPNRDEADTARVTVADVAAGTGPVTALVRINTAWRDGELVRGGVLSWATGPDGKFWLAEADATETTPTWKLRSTDFDALRAEVLDHLPGA